MEVCGIPIKDTKGVGGAQRCQRQEDWPYAQESRKTTTPLRASNDYLLSPQAFEARNKTRASEPDQHHYRGYALAWVRGIYI